ncbi:WxL domain-containing protein [Lactococcus lactis]|uniref:WxL domain-containing protein n=1 Tax=Lactococcus lactis TaxID=1358 RepID=UPI0028915A69|nr:WxL domain-containing protein [Lactococcus lactis]MDT2890782.1 WxL domain-containing protein [Lactococcus lactis]
MKKAITLSAATLALLVAGASGASVKAEPWSSTGTIGFTANTKTPPAITNPEVPLGTGPEVPRGTGPGGTPGELAIDYASDLAFGTHQISSKSATYYAEADTTAFNGTPVGAFVEMHDLRGLGTGNNTQLTVTQLKQFNNGKDYLAGAALSFLAGKAANAGGGAYTPTAEAGFILKPGTAQKVMSTDGTVGQFLTSYGKAADYKGNTAGGPISLSVPSGSALAGDFSTTLVWDLVTAP